MNEFSGVILEPEYAPINDPAWSNYRPCDWCDTQDDTVAYVVQLKKYLCDVCVEGWRFSGMISAGLPEERDEW